GDEVGRVARDRDRAARVGPRRPPALRPRRPPGRPRRRPDVLLRRGRPVHAPRPRPAQELARNRPQPPHQDRPGEGRKARPLQPQAGPQGRRLDGPDVAVLAISQASNVSRLTDPPEPTPPEPAVPVLALARDLMFSGRISATARAINAPLRVIRDPAALVGAQGRRLIVDLNQP